MTLSNTSAAANRAVTEATDEAIKRAHDNQEARVPGWAENALRYLQLYAKLHPEFLIEDVRLSSAQVLDAPKVAGAWGSVTRAAIKAGYIKASGRYGKHKSPQAHSDVKMIWTSLIHGADL